MFHIEDIFYLGPKFLEIGSCSTKWVKILNRQRGLVGENFFHSLFITSISAAGGQINASKIPEYEVQKRDQVGTHHSNPYATIYLQTLKATKLHHQLMRKQEIYHKICSSKRLEACQCQVSDFRAKRCTCDKIPWLSKQNVFSKYHQSL